MRFPNLIAEFEAVSGCDLTTLADRMNVTEELLCDILYNDAEFSIEEGFAAFHVFKMFADVLQQVKECKLEQKLGYEKSERVSNAAETAVSKNYRNGYSKKTVKTQLGEVDVRIPRD